MPSHVLTRRRGFNNLFAPRQEPKERPTPQQLFDQAAANHDFSNKACIRSCGLKTVVLTGVEAGEEKKWVPGKEKTDARWKALFSRKSTTTLDGGGSRQLQAPYRDRDGDTPAFAIVGVTWVEPGLFQGRKAHFLRLHVEHHHGTDQWIHRAELAIRVWRAGDAIRSIAAISDEPLSSIETPAALELADGAPEIALYGPRAAVGRPAGTVVDCFWDGDFHEGDRWNYFAEARPPQHLAYVRPKSEDVWSMLRIVSYGDYDIKEPAPDFDVGLVVLSDGSPFELTAHSISVHQHGGHRIKRHLWSPYNPVRINGKMRLVPKGQKRIGALDFGGEKMKARWKEIVSWTKPYDTVSSIDASSHHTNPQIWFGNRYGCVDNESSLSRSCASPRCRNCRAFTPAST